MKAEETLRNRFCKKRNDFLRRVIAPVDRQGGVTLSYVCPHCYRFLIKRSLLVGFVGTPRETM